MVGEKKKNSYTSSFLMREIDIQYIMYTTEKSLLHCNTRSQYEILQKNCSRDEKNV